MKKILDKITHILDINVPLISNLANCSAILKEIENINWCGFYLMDNSKLYLGPFFGEPACTKIEIGKGVCGTSAKNKQTLIVDDVDKFPGHIRCSNSSKSEIVIPIIVKDRVIGVLDIDSPIYSRFSNEDKIFLEKIVHLIEGLFDE